MPATTRQKPVPFRELEKVKINLSIPPGLLELLDHSRARSRRTYAETLSLALCEHLGVAPAKFGIDAQPAGSTKTL